MTSDELAAWIEEFRRRLDAGELADLGEVRLLPELTIDGERAIRVMLGEVDAYRAMSPEERRLWAGPRQMLARKLIALRDRLAGIPISEAEVCDRERQQPGRS